MDFSWLYAEHWKLLEKMVHTGHKGNIHRTHAWIQKYNKPIQPLGLRINKHYHRNNQRRIGNEIDQISSSTHLFLCYRQNSPGILQPHANTHKLEAENTKQNTQWFRMNDCCKIVQFLACLTIKSFLTNQIKALNQNHYHSLSFTAHLLVPVFISIARCQELQLCREIQLTGYLSFGKQ